MDLEMYGHGTVIFLPRLKQKWKREPLTPNQEVQLCAVEQRAI
ncbi:unnamed protein product [Acanthoscelides obtectus]|uniref:Uncharacterized protein n=1 Tax=Acanthoscelides obtectus TaxID=200917 RepID=A0A9P0Q3S4_ACAOB|nr:unnamed protein product [Acanthoscelides obtectus]CAK1627214.1 hypothetical protein AOBTE_LOCUS4397 [Acanthoscelides obtectus]